VTEAVVVTDPVHPLYGRRFMLASTTAQSGASGYVYVAYRGNTVLRLPVASTNLHPLPRDVARSKLTLEVIRDLLCLVAEGERACPSVPAKSGQACPLTGAASSSTTSSPGSGR
jgi:hypothetical protein